MGAKALKNVFIFFEGNRTANHRECRDDFPIASMVYRTCSPLKMGGWKM